MLRMYTFIETRLFTNLVGRYFSDDEYAAVQFQLAADPERGDVVPGSGGVRKLRWRQPGHGKRGGVRVIYYARIRAGAIWMLTVYAKNEAENISPHILRRIKEEIDG
jgi:hypothetical protein